MREFLNYIFSAQKKGSEITVIASSRSSGKESILESFDLKKFPHVFVFQIEDQYFDVYIESSDLVLYPVIDNKTDKNNCLRIPISVVV